jgi:hypothetical protein
VFPPRATPTDDTPITHADPLLGLTLRAAFELYLRGDYHAARERLLDAKAIARHRGDWIPLNAWLEALDAALSVGVLVTHDLQVAVDPRRI